MTSVSDILDELARDPLRHIVLLKHVSAYPEHVRLHRASGPQGTAVLVLLNASASAYDRETYPQASVAALIESDHPALTATLLSHVPRHVGVVFKLSREADLAPVEAQFAVEWRRGVTSFTSAAAFQPDPGIQITAQPGDAALALFEAQGHRRAWLAPLLQAGRAFACVLERDGAPLSACFAYENYGPVWEVGGVVTVPSSRRNGLAARVVRTALATLAERRLMPRYQVEEDNAASLALAHALGLTPFLRIAHYAHAC